MSRISPSECGSLLRKAFLYELSIELGQPICEDRTQNFPLVRPPANEPKTPSIRLASSRLLVVSLWHKPGGTTAAALDVLMAKDGLAPLIERAVKAARLRAEALSG
jgi:hypothetical protein